jgi:hypothetical protein
VRFTAGGALDLKRMDQRLAQIIVETRIDSWAPGTVRNGSRAHEQPIDQLGIQLCPGSIATATPQTFTMASPPNAFSRLRSRPSTTDGRALRPDPYPPDLSRCHAYGALHRWFLSYAV